MTAALTYLVPLVGVSAACDALAVNRASYYRWLQPKPKKQSRCTPKRALTPAQRLEVLDTLNSERFMQKTPYEVYAELLDDKRYLCSVRTMYRILAAEGQVRERRNLRRHPVHEKPQLVASAPNQVWSWDITKIAAAGSGKYFCLYVVLDIYSRFVVGWTLTTNESATAARHLLATAYEQQGIQRGQLIAHSDRGTAMTATSTATLYAELGITPSFSRPRVSDDNPYSEAAFKTLKYRPEIPARFGSLEHARSVFRTLFDWYNNHHYHSSIALLTPADVHYGIATEVIEARQRVLDTAYARHPERFARPPTHPPVPSATWINPPPTALS